jgi:hypothetical protein
MYRKIKTSCCIQKIVSGGIGQCVMRRMAKSFASGAGRESYWHSTSHFVTQEITAGARLKYQESRLDGFDAEDVILRV